MRQTMRGLRMPEDLYAKLKYVAELEERSTSRQMLMILRNWMIDYEKEHGPVPIEIETEE